MKRTKLRIGCLLLVLVLLLGVLPVTALADGTYQDIHYHLLDSQGNQIDTYDDKFKEDDVNSYNFYKAPSKNGYTFDGWYEKSSDIGDKSPVELPLNFNKKYELYGKYTPVTYVISYTLDDKDAVNSLNNPTTYTVESATIKLEPATNGSFDKEFLYWKDQYGNRVDEIPTGSYGNWELTAVWSNAVNYHVVNGNYEEVDSYTDSISGSSLALEDYSKTGYNFSGWYQTLDDLKEDHAKVTTVTNDKKWELYGQITPISYTIAFDSNGGAGTMASISATYDVPVKLSANSFTKQGAKFLGWATTPDGNVVYKDLAEVKNLTTVDNGTVTLYAQWENTDSTPDLSFNVDDNFPSSQEVGTYRDVKLTIFGDKGLGWQYGAKLLVTVQGPKGSDAKLWYDRGSDFSWWRYVDVIDNDEVFSDLDFNEKGLSIPLSLYLDKRGDYTFYFTLKDKDGNVLATDTAKVTAYTETAPDYRVYIDAGKHGTVTVSDRYASKGDRVIIYAKPDKGYALDTLKVYDKYGDRVDVYPYGSNYAFKMPSSYVTVYATFKEVNYDHFTDVPKNSWYYDAVYYVYNHDIMDGIGNRTFNPYGDLSRAMIVTTLYRMEGEPTVRTSGTFRDVPENTWYTDAVEWAAKEGIVKGYGKKTFGPGNSVTLEQLVAILQRYADYKGYDVDETVRLYADAVVSQWAVDNVRWAVAEGLLRDGRSVNATKVATRAEIAYALYGFMTNVAD